LLIFYCFFSRYDTDIFAAFGVRYNDHLAFQDAKTDKMGFAKVETLIRGDNYIAIEHFWDIEEIYAMFFDIGSAFSFISFIPHVLIVITKCSSVKQKTQTFGVLFGIGLK
jgi:sigma54-dependent transcription regulator